MTTSEDILITERCWRAYQSLKDLREIETDQGFCDRFKFDRSNLRRAKKMGYPVSLKFISVLVHHYNISATWIITGVGHMRYRDKPISRQRARIEIVLCDN